MSHGTEVRPDFVRFVTYGIHPRSIKAPGLFTAAYELRAAGLLEEHEELWFAETVGWFEQHVKAPKSFDLPSWTKDEGRVIFWFRAGAHEPIQRMHHLALMLAHHGTATRMLRTAKPGRVVYEDEVQIAVIPLRYGER